MIEFFLHGGTLALAWFLLVNLAMSAAVVAGAGWIIRRWTGADSAAIWFAARVLPAATALLFVGVVFVPSYWKYEPRDVVEGFDITLTALALGAAALLTTAIVRGVGAWRGAVRRTRVWMQSARPIAMGGTGIAVYEIDVDTPLMALVGVLRPRLLVTRGLVAALTDEELAASIAHEVGHSRARDNLTRLLMRATPDLLTGTPAARAIERRWASAAEHRADRMAADDSPVARCALASALVKVARLTPAMTPLAEPISTLIDGGEIASRVERLLADATPSARSRAAFAWTALALGAAVTVVVYAPALRFVHSATELLVHSLP
jgi:beta-lactamase regulating signal transducer with metallopeptidase domain